MALKIAVENCGFLLYNAGAMDSLLLEALPREARGTSRAGAVRRAGKIPAVYYGAGQKSATLQLDYQAFRKVFSKAGENTIIELTVDGKKYPVLVHDIQYDPVADTVAHVDFIHVDMQKEVTTSVKIVVVGIAPAVKNLGGILDVQKQHVKIKCLPKDLIHSIEVDVSSIADFHTSIHVKDLKVPSTIKLLDSPEDTVVTATHSRVEEEAAAAPTAAADAATAAATAAAEAAAAAPGGAAPATGGQPAAKEKEAKK